MLCSPEGLRNLPSIDATPERSSVADQLTVTTTGPADVSMVVGVKLNTVRVGGVTSWIWAKTSERDIQKNVTTNASPAFDERSIRNKDWSCIEARYMGFSL